eukprot:scaffold1399_cov410-Prasinococcus_capsulatus_cf.AAC.32
MHARAPQSHNPSTVHARRKCGPACPRDARLPSHGSRAAGDARACRHTGAQHARGRYKSGAGRAAPRPHQPVRCARELPPRPPSGLLACFSWHGAGPAAPAARWSLGGRRMRDSSQWLLASSGVESAGESAAPPEQPVVMSEIGADPSPQTGDSALPHGPAHEQPAWSTGATKRRRRRFLQGLGLVLLVAIIWVASSYIVRGSRGRSRLDLDAVKDVLNQGIEALEFTYVCNSLFLIYIPIYEIDRLWKKWTAPKQAVEKQSLVAKDTSARDTPQAQTSGADLWGTSGKRAMHDSDNARETPREDTGSERTDDLSPVRGARATRWQTAKVSLMICPLWFMGQYFFNASLKTTSVSSNTILSSTSSLFTLTFGCLFLNERFTWLRLGSVLMCVAGVSFVGMSDSSEGGTNTLGGDGLCLASAAIYGVYSTLLRKRLKDGFHSNVLFFGFVGLFNAVLVFPVLLVVIALREGPKAYDQITLPILGLTVLKGLVDNVLSDLLWSMAVVYTDATVATVCLNIQIPMALMIDILWKDKGDFGRLPLHLCGAFFVILACIGINLRELVLDRESSRRRDPHSHNVNGSRSHRAVDKTNYSLLTDDASFEGVESSAAGRNVAPDMAIQ